MTKLLSCFASIILLFTFVYPAQDKTASNPSSGHSTGSTQSCDGALDIVPTQAMTFVRKRRLIQNDAQPYIESIGADQLRTLIANHRGKVLAINIWATWCAPCVREIPDLLKLEQENRASGLKLIGISMDEPGDLETVVKPFVKSKFPGFTTYHCRESSPDKLIGSIDRAWNEVIPTTFVIDRTGKLRHTISGAKTPEEFEKIIKPLLTEPAQ